MNLDIFEKEKSMTVKELRNYLNDIIENDSFGERELEDGFDIFNYFKDDAVKDEKKLQEQVDSLFKKGENMIAVLKLIRGQKCYLYDEAGNIELFPSVIAARVSLAMNGITEDRINSGEFLFELWKDPEEVKQEPTENEKKMQEQIDKLLAEVEDLKKERDYYKDGYYAAIDAVLNDPMI